MKAYTDLNQSKKLEEILSLESADMYYPYFGDNKWGETARFGEALEYSGRKDIHCWSLAALVDVLPETMLGKDKNGYVVMAETMGSGLVTTSNNSIDACYEMIIKLNELKML